MMIDNLSNWNHNTLSVVAPDAQTPCLMEPLDISRLYMLIQDAIPLEMHVLTPILSDKTNIWSGYNEIN